MNQHESIPSFSSSKSVEFRPAKRRSWEKVGATWVAGYAFQRGELLNARRLAQLLDSIDTGSLRPVLNSLNGNFAAVRHEGDATYAIADHVRGIPLLIADTGRGRIVTDDVETAMASVSPQAPDWQHLAEFLTTTYVTGSHTLIPDISQVEAGCFVRLLEDTGSQPAITRWYSFRPHRETIGKDDLVEAGLEAMSHAVARAITSAGDCQIILPLTAGLDSGILAWFLANQAVDQDRILTYTFGRPESKDVQGARKLANRFGLKWEFVPYSLDTWRSLRKQSTWTFDIRSASSLSAAPNLSHLPAVIQLRERGVISDGATVMPGHTLDFLAGSWIPGTLARRSTGTHQDLIDAILTTHYRLRSRRSLVRLLDRYPIELAQALRERVEASLPTMSSEPWSRELMVSFADEWTWKERQAKFIVNSVRAYELAGIQWRLPWWDREVLDVWASVPLSQRLGMGLREQMGAELGLVSGESSLAGFATRTAERVLRRVTIEAAAKRMRNSIRNLRRNAAYINHPTALYGLVEEAYFRQSYSGRENPWAFLAEELIRTLWPNSLEDM